MPKTNAEYCRDYRQKKKLNKVKKIPKSSTERVREFRARQKAVLNVQDMSDGGNNALQISEEDHFYISEDILHQHDDTIIGHNLINKNRPTKMEYMVEINQATDSRNHLAPHCDVLTAAIPETVIMKQETDLCVDEEKSPRINYMYPSEPSATSEYVNYFDSTSFPLEKLKKEIPVEECPRSGDSMNSKAEPDYPSEPSATSEYVNYFDSTNFPLEKLKKEIPVEECPRSGDSMDSKAEPDNKDFFQSINRQNVKKENTDQGLLLNIKKEDNDVEYQFTLKTELCEEQKVFDNAEDMNSMHYEVPVTPREIQCSFDNKSFINSTKLDHSNEHSMKFDANESEYCETNEFYKCKYCDDSFNYADDMDAHVSYVHRGNTFNCELCGKRYKRELNLERHILFTHKHRTRPPNKAIRNILKCKYCNVCYKYKYKLNDHVKMCHSVVEDAGTVYRCDSCDGVYKSKQSLSLHIKRMHYDYGNVFDCWCGEKFRSPIHLSIHKRTQHGVKVARKKLKRNNLRHRVMRAHCDYGETVKCWCGKVFRSPVHLHDHERLCHERTNNTINVDKYQCDTCKRFFKRKQCLIVHIKRIHYDYGKVFECWCGKQFRSPIQLNVHKKAQHVLLYGGFKFCL